MQKYQRFFAEYQRLYLDKNKNDHSDLPPKFCACCKSKICHGRSRNSSIVESQGYFILEWPFLQFHEQRAKFANKVDHLTRFFEKVDSQLPSRLMMLIRQPTKDENGCELTLNRRYTIFEPLLQFNKAK